MKKINSISFLVLFSYFIYSCSSTNASSAMTNDGSSFEKAIKVKSVQEEYRLMKDLCPDCEFVSQGLSSNGKKNYDVLTFKKPSGEKVKYYFDISSFFGKW